jgi:hypothetical protein
VTQKFQATLNSWGMRFMQSRASPVRKAQG